jgi:hypothetical protein
MFGLAVNAREGEQIFPLSSEKRATTFQHNFVSICKFSHLQLALPPAYTSESLFHYLEAPWNAPRMGTFLFPTHPCRAIHTAEIYY